jgi:hypothetical protein
MALMVECHEIANHENATAIKSQRDLKTTRTSAVHELWILPIFPSPRCAGIASYQTTQLLTLIQRYVDTSTKTNHPFHSKLPDH